MTQGKKRKFGVFIQLEADEEAAFLKFKKALNIKNHAEAARKLMLDQLDLINAPVSDRKKSDTRGARELAA